MNRIFILSVFTLLAGVVPLRAADKPDVADLFAHMTRYESGSEEVALRTLEGLINRPDLDQALRNELERGLIRLLGNDSTFEARRFAALNLAVIGGDNAVEALAGMLDSAETAGLACFALGRIASGKAGDALRTALPASQGLARVQIIDTLGRRAEAASVPPLAALARGADTEEAAAAVRALATIPDRSALDELTALASGPEGVSAEIAAALLGAAHHRLAAGAAKELPELCEPLLDNSFPAHIRRGALELLLASDKDGGERRIARLLDDKKIDDLLAAVAIARVATLPGKSVSKKFGKRFKKLSATRQVMLVGALAVRNDKAALEAIKKQVRAEAAEVRLAAVKVIGKTGGAEAVNLLAGALAAAENPDEVTGVQQAMSSLSGGDATDRNLIEFFGASETRLKVRLFPVLARRGGGAAVNLLLDHACGEDREIAREASQALTRVADAGDAVSLAAVSHSATEGEGKRQASALRTLAAWRGSGAWETLQGIYVNSEGARRSLALRGMVRMASEAGSAPNAELLGRYRALLDGARTDDERKLILGALAGVAHPDALGMAVALLDLPGVREEAAVAVRRMAEALAKSHPEAASKALARLGE
ncbi:MAG: hypothetical protein PHU80_08925, partial [Kiritimatiellae bacterium]|nr:hypothetical protein [Kiritimatiellia bacterium]